MSNKIGSLPHWDLSNVYSALDGDDVSADFIKLGEQLDRLDQFIKEKGIGRIDSIPSELGETAGALNDLIGLVNETSLLLSTLNAYIYSFITTDSYNRLAQKRQSELEQLEVRFTKQNVRFTAWVGSLGDSLGELCELSSEAATHRLALEDIVEESRYQMSEELEDLNSELQLSGGGAMWKLQGTVTSQLKWPVVIDGTSELMPMTKIRNLAGDESEAVRRAAYEAEMEAWASIREPVAFSLNCVKGSSITLSKRRGQGSVLEAALQKNHADQATLDALLGAIKEFFPVLRGYLTAKAKKLGKEKLPWWDLFAPVGDVNPSYSWEEARDFVVKQFGVFSPELAGFADNAFEKRWIDAEPREGKRGGAFCMRVPAVKESRILANFDGSFDQMITLAHELGHGYHNFCQRDLTPMRSGSPMILAETASIFCETLVFDAALASASPEEQLSILENQLRGALQVTVDIYSRFLFESEVVKRRQKAELSADDFCEIMLDAQRQTYGEAMDQSYLHQYLWLLKPHYYYGTRDFYNFPYAFGLLFGQGMYAIYQKEGASFIPRYQELLRSTGAGKAADLAGRFDIDLRSRDFWLGSLEIVRKQIELYKSV